MPADLLKLPWEIQVALASGYAAYVVAYTGLRSRHKAVDVLLLTLVFGLIATAVLAIDLKPVLRGALAVIASLACGLIWRKWGRGLTRYLLRKFNVTWADDSPSALETISESTDHPITQIAVLLDDGTWLRCDDATKFAKSPHGPCVIGPNGDVALYITHEEKKDGEPKEQSTVLDASYGDRITYVPASRIRFMNIRHLRKS